MTCSVMFSTDGEVVTDGITCWPICPMLSLPRVGSLASISLMERSDPAAAAGGFKDCRRDGTGLPVGLIVLCGRLGVPWTICGGVNRSPDGFQVPLLARRLS